MKPKIILFTGPSGAGKTTLVKKLCQEHKGFQPLLSYTTRQKRKSEQNGEDYWFVSQECFTQLLKEKKFIEFIQHKDGTYYGMPFPVLAKGALAWVAITSSEGIFKLSKILQDRFQVIVVLVDAPDKELRARIKKRGDNFFEMEKRATLWEKERSTKSIADLVIGQSQLEVEIQKVLELLYE